jgi:predicted lactoylglutathione lyase
LVNQGGKSRQRDLSRFRPLDSDIGFDFGSDLGDKNFALGLSNDQILPMLLANARMPNVDLVHCV